MRAASFLLFIIFAIIPILIQAQCPPVGFPEPGNTCPTAPILCDSLDGYCATINNNNISQNFPGCPSNVLNNDEWFAFIANSTTITIEVVPSNCSPGFFMGLQGAIYQGCGGPVMDTQCDCTENPFILTSTNYIIGEVYWFVLDGCAGNVCDYAVNVLAGSTVGNPPGAPGGITGAIAVCPDDTENYSIAAVTGATIYNWVLTPPIGTITNNDENISIDWNGGGGTTELCVDVENLCFTNPATSCMTITVNAEAETTLDESVCVGGCFTVGTTDFCTAGTFTEVLQTFQGCDSTVTLNLSIIEPAADIAGNNIIDCNNMTLSLDGSGSGPAGITYNWTTVDGNIVGSNTGVTIDIDEPGTYDLEVSFTQGGVTCTHTESFTVTEDTTPPIADITPPPGLDCINMSITIDGSGSTNGSGITYDWTGPSISGGSGNSTVDVDGPGTYTLVVTNTENGCTAEEMVTVMEDVTPPIINILPPETLTCATTSIDIDATGSDNGPNFTFDWTGGSIVGGGTTLTPTVSGPGTYTLTITNSTNGCTETQDVTVSEDVTPPPATINAPNQLDCNNSTVTIDATGSGGPNTTFVWSTIGGNIVSGSGTLMPTVDGPGQYTIVVTDTNNGCTAEESVSVLQNLTPPIVDAGPDQILDCNNATISISGSVTGGNNNTITWTTTNGNIISGGNTMNPNVDQPGTYSVVVTNGDNGCTAEDMVTVTEDMVDPTAVALPPPTVTCTNTMVDLDGTGSSTGPNFTYTWAGGGIVNGGNTLTPTVNSGGSYTLTITNTTNGCTADVTVNVPEDTVDPPVNIAPPGQLDCTNSTLVLDGTGSGGANTTFVWTGGGIVSGGTTLNPTINGPGTYTLTVTDSNNGCTSETSVTVNQDNTPPTVNAGPDLVLDCNNPNVVSVDGSGSTSGPGIVIGWTTIDGNIQSGANTLNPNVTEPGTYTLTITNSNNGCTGTDQVVVTENLAEPTVVVNSAGQIDCFTPDITLDGIGSSNGPNYSIIWTGPGLVTGNTTLTPLINAGGTYTLIITDLTNGCTDSENIVISEDLAAPIASIVPPGQIDCNNPVLLMTGSNNGAGGNINVTWTTVGGNILSGANTYVPLIDQPGTYTLTLENPDNGCTDETTVTITEDTTPPVADAGPDLTIDCINTNQVILGGNSSSGGNISLQWTNIGGNIISGGNTLTPTVSAGGTYNLVITNLLNGCTAEDEVIITQDNIPPFVIISQPEFLTCDLGTISIDGSNSSNDPGLTYLWVTSSGNIVSGTNSPIAQVDATGTYTLVVNNPQNFCSASSAVVVLGDTEPPIADILPPDVINCNNSSVFLDGNGSSSPGGLSFEWTTNDGNILSGGTTLNPEVDQAGTYILTVTNDDNNCTDEATIVVGENFDTPTADAGVDATIGCTQPNLQLNGGLSSSGVNFDYLWTDQNNNTVATGTLTPTIGTAGTYNIIVTDLSSGCTAEDEVVISQDVNLPTIDVAPVDFITCTQFDVLLDATNSDNGVDFDFLWETTNGSFANGQNTLSPTVSSGGTYTLTITNNTSGCAASQNIIVTEDNLPPDLTLATPDLLNCANSATNLAGNTTINPNNLQISWSTQNGNITGTTNTLNTSADMPGDYLLTITSLANGCANSETVTVIENVAVPTAAAGADLILDCVATSVELDGSQSSSGNDIISLWENENGDTVATNTLTPSTEFPGTYYLMVTNTLSACFAIDSVLVGQDTNAPIVEIAAADTLTCTTELINLDASNSDSGTDFQITWETMDGNITSGSSTLTPEVDSSGTYTLTILNTQNNCEVSQQIIVNQDIEAPTAEIAIPDTLNCVATEIVLDAQSSGSNAAFTFSWLSPNGNFTTNTDSLAVGIDAPGDYSLELINTENGCTASAAITVDQDIEIPVADAGADLTLLCTVPNVTLDGSQSSMGNIYQYAWEDENQSIISIEQNPAIGIAGNYSLIVTNIENGCTAEDEVIVGQDDNVPTIEISPSNMLTCAVQNISIDASNSDNGTDFTIVWDSQDGNILSGGDGLMPTVDAIGTYSLTILNTTNGCAATQNVLIEEDLTPPSPQIAAPDTLTCSQESLFLNAAGSGDEADFQINWATTNGILINGIQTLNPEIGAPGTYTLNLINNSNGCAADLDVEVPQDILSPIAEAGATDLLDCNIMALELNGSGTQANQIAYAWQTVDGEIVSGNDSQNPTIGAPGIYTLTITNLENGCTNSDDVQIDEDVTVPPIAIINPDLLTCEDTIVTVDASNSASGANYSILWTSVSGNILDGDTTLMLTVDEVGDYILNITDTQNGCQNSETIGVQQDISSLNVNIDNPELLTCATLNTTLIANQNGGNDLTFVWDTQDGNIQSGQNDPNAIVDAPGLYTLIITETSNGCTAETEIQVNQDIQDPIADSGASATVSCTEPEAILDGGLSSNGTNFSYLWTSIDGNIVGGANTLNPVVDAGGDYNLLVTNTFNGCTAESLVTVEQESQLPDISIAEPDSLTCTLLSLELEGIVTGGDLSLFDIIWTSPNGNIVNNGNTLNPTINEPGTYILTLENSQSADCVTSTQIEVATDLIPPEPIIEQASMLTCAITSFEIDASNSSSIEDFSIAWSTTNGNIQSGGNTLMPTINQPGDYEITLTNLENGCTASQSIEIEQNIEDPIAVADVNGELNCNVEALNLDGTNSSNGLQYAYNWTTSDGTIMEGQTTLTPVISDPGTYYLQVMDIDNGCDDMDEVMVGENILDPIAVAGDPVEINCATGEASLNGMASSGSTNLEFSWSTNNGNILIGQNSPTPTVNEIGDYLLMVTNLDNGCTSEDAVPVILNLPIGEVGSTDPFCIDETGSIEFLSVASGTPPYQYSFDGGNNFSTTPTAFNVEPGAYSVLVQDEKGCEYEETVLIESGLEATLSVEPEVALQLGDSYQINTLLNFPESELQSVTWTPATNLSCADCLTPIATPTDFSVYQVDVTTKDGCEASGVIRFVVSKDIDIYVPNAFSPNGDGTNDVLLIYADQKRISRIKSFLGFNRWGETVFQFFNFDPNDPNFGWDGTHRGEPMNPAVFVWFAEIEFLDGRVELYKGDVVLMR